MKIVNLIQGSAEWLEHRRNHKNASEAAAMLGLDPKTRRDDLIRMKATGSEKEFSSWVQENILDKGHDVEAQQRVLIEEDHGIVLYPVTGTEDEGDLSASFDGITMLEDVGFEHKQLNKELFAQAMNGQVPDSHMPQLQQQLMVSGAEKILFVVSDGTRANRAIVEVLPDQAWFQRIRDGWVQFERDVEAYEHVEIKELPKSTATVNLPTIMVQITGAVLTNNLGEFEIAATGIIETIKTELVTDEDFADAAKLVTKLDEGEKTLERTKNEVLAQAADINDVMATIDRIKELMRAKRLTLSKSVEAEKTRRRADILQGGKDKFTEYLVEAEKDILPIKLDIAMPDFGAAMSGKKTMASLHGAVNDLVASSKTAIDAKLRDTLAKMDWYNANVDGHTFLFADLGTIIHKESEFFQMLVNQRIKEHKDAEEKRKQEEAQQAEQAKPVEQPAVQTQVAYSASPAVETRPAASALPVANDVPDNGATIKLGVIATLLGFSVTADFITSLGFSPSGRERSAVLYREVDLPNILEAIANHVHQVRADFIMKKAA